MTRMQEIPWVEKIPLHEQEVQIQERLQRPGRLNLYQLTWLRPLIESRWPQLILRVATLSGFVFTIRSEVQIQERLQRPGRLNLYQLTWLRPLIESRWPQLILRVATLSGFVFTIAVCLFGSLVGSHNFAIIFVWIAWWTAL